MQIQTDPFAPACQRAAGNTVVLWKGNKSFQNIHLWKAYIAAEPVMPLLTNKLAHAAGESAHMYNYRHIEKPRPSLHRIRGF